MEFPTGYQTAISRKEPPEPLKWLHDNNYIKGRAFDFGSGRGCWFGMECYDPYYRPQMPEGKFDTITCIYVLNVVTEEEQGSIIENIRKILKPNGQAYFAVRRDIPKIGKQGRGTIQRYVVLDLPTLKENSSYAIYMIEPENFKEFAQNWRS
jgi:SAM-dependent methyltransferase